MNKRLSLTQLPAEILFKFFNERPSDQQARLACTCRIMRDLYRDSDTKRDMAPIMSAVEIPSEVQDVHIQAIISNYRLQDLIPTYRPFLSQKYKLKLDAVIALYLKTTAVETDKTILFDRIQQIPRPHELQSDYTTIISQILKKYPLLIFARHDSLGPYHKFKRFTPLHAAVYHGKTEVVHYLLSRKADVNAMDIDGWGALHIALVQERPDLALALINAGANVHAINGDGNSPLHIAAKKGYDDIVDKLIGVGADVDVSVTIGVHEGYTPLHWALRHGNQTTITLLLQKGADTTQITKFGFSPLGISRFYRNITSDHVVPLLENSGL